MNKSCKRNLLENITASLVEYHNSKNTIDELYYDLHHRANGPASLSRCFCAWSYLGDVNNSFFQSGAWDTGLQLLNGVITNFSLPHKMTPSQAEYERFMSKRLENKVAKALPYDNRAFIDEFCGGNDDIYEYMLPVEKRMFYMMFVSKTIFTADEIAYMKSSPLWSMDFLTQDKFYTSIDAFKKERHR